MGNIIGNASPGGPWNGTSAPDGSTAVSNPDAGNTGIGWAASSSLTGTGILVSVDTTGFSSFMWHTTGSGVGGTIVIQGSNDNINWINISNLYRSEANVIVAQMAAVPAQTLSCPCLFRYMRVNLTVYSSGTVTGFYALRTSSVLYGPVVSGTVASTLSASTTGGYSYTHIAAGQATTTVKSGAGTLHSIVLNSAATATNVTTVFDSTTGSGSVIAIPAVTTATVPTTLIFDLAFATGLTILTATANGGDMTVCYK